MSWHFGSGCFELFGIVGRFLGPFVFERPMVEVRIGELAAGKMTRKKVFLRRYETDKFGTRGMLTLPSGTQLYVLEPSPRAKNPCIQVGAYVCEWTTEKEHPRFGPCYEIKGVKGRSDILWHPGSWAGDPAFGLKTDSLGCLMPGRAIGELWNREAGNQLAVLSSRDALSAIVAELERESFILEISWSSEVAREVYA
jgi:hypothetical protein